MADLASLDDLKARLDWTLDAGEERIAATALEDLSDFAREYSGREWEDAYSAPRMACKLVLKAAVRYMRNPDGFTQSRAGDETTMWNDDAGTDAGTAFFNAAEIKLLTKLGGKAGGLISVPVVAWRPRHVPEGYVKVTGSDEKPFPLFASDESPW